MKTVSFIIPCYNSAATLPGVVADIQSTMADLPHYRHDIILVNDCSPDDTFAVIEQLCALHANITGVNLSKNFGQHAALMAGMALSAADIVVCLDDDGQTPANQAGRLLDAIEEGHDAVYARYTQSSQSAFRRFGSWLNDRMASALLGKPRDLQVTSYFAVRRFLVDEMLRYQNPFPYVVGLVLRATNNIVNVDVDHRPRAAGESGYTLGKLASLWINGFTTFSVKPLRVATLLGALFAAGGFIFSIVTIIRKFVDSTMQAGWASMICAILVSSGLLMLMMGLLGEYIGRTYITINCSPQYVVREIVGPNKPMD